MRVALVQVSDVHLRQEDTELRSRFSKLAGAAWGAARETKFQFLLLSGDIAFSGMTREYEVAQSLFEGLLSRAPEFIADPQVEVLAVPGNHDCDFSTNGDVREILVGQGAQKYAQLPESSPVFQQLMAPQSAFFEFAAKISKSAGSPSTPRVKWIVDRNLGGRSMRFLCLNSAIASKKNERQGDLFLCEAAIREIESLPAADLTVTLMHHPLSWLESNHGLVVRSALLSSCGLVFTGHQHVRDEIEYKRLGTGGFATMFEAPQFFGADEHESGFRLIVVDLEAMKTQESEFKWNGSEFELSRGGKEWLDLSDGQTTSPFRFAFRPEFQARLEDPGMAFTHPRKDHLVLTDIYVPQDLVVRSIEVLSEKLVESKRIPAEQSLPFILEKEKCLVIGEERSGKSSLAKTLVSRLRDLDFVPLLISGSELVAKTISSPRSLLDVGVERQYGASSIESFSQLERGRRALVVDDVHLSRLNRQGLRDALRALEPHFSRVYVFADEIFRFEALGGDKPATSAFADFASAELLPMGFRLRAKLIERWNLIGREREVAELDLAQQVAREERTVSSLIGKNLLPSHPFAVLTILQLMEAGRDGGMGSCAFGEMYGQLIAESLSKNSTPGNTDINNSFLSLLARCMFENDRQGLTRQEVRGVARQYEESSALSLGVHSRLRDLGERRILQESEGTYSFRYPYIYYYFLARWFRDQVAADPTARAELLELANFVYSERNTNILVFYLSLIRDVEVIERVLSNAEEIFNGVVEVKLEGDVDFLNDLFKGQRALPTGGLGAGLDGRGGERHRGAMDRIATESDQEEEAQERIRYGDELDEVIKLNIAFKTLHILGQFVRNFPGSLSARLKERIVDACYRLGLRSFASVLRLTENSLDGIRTYFAVVARDRHALLSEAEARKRGDEAVLFLLRGFGFGVTKRISNAIGLEELAQTLDAVLKNNDSTATRLIDVSVRLDHFKDVPGLEVKRLRESLSRNHYAFVLLRDMVFQHLRLFPVPHQARQKLLSAFDVQAKDGAYMDDPRRLLGPAVPS